VRNGQDQARLQEIEKHLRNLDERVSVLSAVDGSRAKQVIAETFKDPRTVIIYRGVQRGKTQQQIAAALRERSLPQALQQRVSDTFSHLEDLGFLRRRPDKAFDIVQGWDDFGLEKVMRKTLLRDNIADLK
jgi:hypothetical protein